MLSVTILMAREIMLAAVLAASVLTDIYWGKVLNVVVAPTMILGLACGAILGGLTGLAFSGVGLLVGGGILLVPFLFGVMGGGDVKLAAAVGSLAGAVFVLEALAYAFVLAAALALLTRAVQGRCLELLMSSWHIIRGVVSWSCVKNGSNLSSASGGGNGLPFAACLAGGALGAKWFSLFNLIVGT